MEDDQEICRVCRCESTRTKPLYHPCKCTGSIRHIHQQCLLEWLAHSRKDYCELCEHPFVFTPIYRQDMPAQIPLYLVVGQCLLRCVASLKVGLRGFAVGLVWLVLLPYMILWSWRLCFSPSINIDGWLSDETRLSFKHDQHQQPHFHDSSSSGYDARDFLMDCFKGQIITMAWILVVAAAFVFREWVAQNIPLEAEQESETEQDVDTPLPEDKNVDHQRPQSPPIEFEVDNDMVSILTQQQSAVDALLEALKQVDDDCTFVRNDNDLKKHLEDLHHDLRQEIEKTQQQTRFQERHDRQWDRQQQQPRADHSLGNNKNNNNNNNDHATEIKGWMNSDFFQLDTNDDDETQIENMMQSIMVQDPAKSPVRYSWDDLQKNSHYLYRNDRQQSKRNSPTSSSLLSTSSITLPLDNKIPSSSVSINDQLLENMSISRLTVGNDLLNQQHPISINLPQRKTDIPASTLETSSTINSNNTHSNNNTLNNIFSGPKLSTPFAYESSLLSRQAQQLEQQQQRTLFEKRNRNGSDVTYQSHHLDSNNDQHYQIQPIDTNDQVLEEEDMEDGTFNLGGDIDGVLEAIGMRGNPWVLLQNSILAFIIISCCLAVAVCIPYLVGRLIIMIRPLHFVVKMIGTLQHVTSPLMDYVLDHWCPLIPLMTTHGLDTFLALFVPNHGVLFSGWSSLLASILKTNGSSSNGIDPASSLSLNNFQFSVPIKRLLSGNNGTTTTFTTHSFMTNHQQALAMTEMKNILHAVSGKIIDRWHRFAVGQSELDRGVCTIVGYVTLLCIGSWYLTFQRHQQYANGHQRRASYTIQQFGMFVKVVFFVTLELVFLPLLCGGLLHMVMAPLMDVSSTPWMLFAANISCRPYWNCFLYWFVGTCFIYETAVFISICRATVRPGVMWFIRDTNDHSFQLLQEIMDRPLFGLLCKLCTATLIYMTLIVGAIGSVIWTVTQYTGIQQLRWTFSEPLFSVATDIMAAQYLLPILVSSIKPRDTFKQTLCQWWHVMAHQLRLSSFMFGERYFDEEGVYMNQTWCAWIPSFFVTKNAPDMSVIGNDTNTPSELLQMDGMLARVPNQDTLTIYSQQRRNMCIPVDSVTLEPIDPAEKRLDDSATNEQQGGAQDDTVVVYLPPHFNVRVILFLFSMWLCGSAMACSLTFGPLLLGRFLLETYLAPGKQIHDVYPYVLGVCVVTLSINTIRSVAQGTNNYLKQEGGHAGLLTDLLDKLSAYVRQKILNGCRLLYLTIMIGWLIPLLTGLAADLYLFAPFRSNSPSSQLALTTALVYSDHWHNGLVYLGIMYRLVNILPTTTWQRVLDQHMSGGLSSLDLWVLTRTVLAPWIIIAASAIMIPGGSVWIVLHLLAVEDASIKLWALQCVYFCVLSMIAILVVVILGIKLLNLWKRVVRDDTYLIGKQLHNLDDQGHVRTILR